MATSEDGIEWTRYDNPETTDTLYAESDPLFDPIETGADVNFAMQPQVVQTEDGWQWFYGVLLDMVILAQHYKSQLVMMVSNG